MAEHLFDRMQRAREKLIPNKGYNLVGVDTMESDPAEALYLVDHFDDRKEAEAEAARRQKGQKLVRYYVYGPEDA